MTDQTMPEPFPAATVARGMRRLPIAARLALKAMSQLAIGALRINLPDGRSFRFAGSQPGGEGVIDVRDWRMFSRALRGGSLGFAEAYLDGLWESPDVAQVLYVASLNAEAMGGVSRGTWLVNAVARLQHLLRPNTKKGSERNIHAHYDLGNDFYRLWLDPSMTYSAAFFEKPSLTLAQAQRAKYANLARMTGVSADHKVIEVGCGWGGFAEFAAREIGCHVTGITISREQLAYGQKRIFDAGLNEKVSLEYCDYRDLKGAYDRAISIEMFEAVGEKYWPGYFAKLHEILKPGGAAGLQVITIDEKWFEGYRRRADFIQRYVFPGGMLPSPTVLAARARDAGFATGKRMTFGLDYARTLAEWHKAFEHAWPELSQGRFDARFKRLWTYYLAYCEAGFRSKSIDVEQTVFHRG
ncbi:MAG TPA: cyclopropane-fatty-acyl-phospholipid synthase family protein [Micropepsaceae bacterium]|nr:cyclopropane-fatty-acyl-phospholipid synthase family protein [Micropepsaceae bacterium]